jgi:hypothetical protein
MTRSCYIIFVKKWVHNGRSEVYEAEHKVFGTLAHYRKNYEIGKPVKIVPEYTLDIREITEPFPDSIKVVLAGPPEKLKNGDFVKPFHPPKYFGEWIDPDDRHRAGARLRYDERTYRDRPDFLPFIDETPEFEPEEPQVPEAKMMEYEAATKIPIADRVGFTEYHNEHPERFAAELLARGEYSEQLPDIPRYRKDLVAKMKQMFDKTPGPNRRLRWQKVNRVLTKKDNNPFKFDPTLMNWGLAQSAKDDVTFLAAMQQRIRWSTIDKNYANLSTQKDFGRNCWEAFRRYMGWEHPFAFDDHAYDLAREEFQERRGARTEALKKGSLNRTDPDYNMTITMKTQWKLKDRVFSLAKPGQPVMIHADAYLFEWGPRGVYLLDKILEKAPPNWMLYAKKTPEEFETWVSTFLTPDEVLHMNDLKGQDQSVQGWGVEFFSHLLRWFGFPEETVLEFVHEKLSKVVRDKIMAIMTDSGEVWTYLINTTTSTARECFMYNIPYGHPMANGGDDTMRRGGLTPNPMYVVYSHVDPCEDKRFDSVRGEFCSFIVKKSKLFKDPIILLKRFIGKISMGAGEDAVKGYAYLWVFNYLKKEHLMECLDEDELEAHQIMTRMMFNLKKEGLTTRPDWSILKLDGELFSDRTHLLSKMEILDSASLPVNEAVHTSSLVESRTQMFAAVDSVLANMAY